jgi:hypothetical protein
VSTAIRRGLLRAKAESTLTVSQSFSSRKSRFNHSNHSRGAQLLDNMRKPLAHAWVVISPLLLSALVHSADPPWPGASVDEHSRFLHMLEA